MMPTAPSRLPARSIGVLAGVTYAAFLLIYQHANRTPGPRSGPLLDSTLGMVAGALASAAFDPHFTFVPGPAATLWLVLLAIGSQVIGWLLIGTALPQAARGGDIGAAARPAGVHRDLGRAAVRRAALGVAVDRLGDRPRRRGVLSFQRRDDQKKPRRPQRTLRRAEKIRFLCDLCDLCGFFLRDCRRAVDGGDFGGGAAAALDRAVHVALPLDAGVLAGEEQPPGRPRQPGAQRRVERRDRSRRSRRARTGSCSQTICRDAEQLARPSTRASRARRPAPRAPCLATIACVASLAPPPASSARMPARPRCSSLPSHTAPNGSGEPNARGRPAARQKRFENCSSVLVARPYFSRDDRLVLLRRQRRRDRHPPQQRRRQREDRRSRS